MDKNEFDQLTDKRFLEPKIADVGHSDEVKHLLERKGKIVNSSWNTNEINGRDQIVYDKDAEAFDIIPDVSEIKVGEVVKLFAFAKKTATNLTPNDPNVVWESDNWDVAFFTDRGVLHARKVGEAIITATDIENPSVEPVSRTISVVSYNGENEGDTPGGNDNPDPGTDPVDPGTDPDNPGGNTEPDPGTNPDDPGQGGNDNPGGDDPNPGDNPGGGDQPGGNDNPDPGTDPNPGGNDNPDPGTDPVDPGTDPNPGGNDNPDPGTDPVDPGTDPDQPQPQEPEVVKPEAHENTEAQAANATDLAAAMTNTDEGTKAYTATYDEINNLTVPADAGRSATITGAVQDGATITNESTGKYVTITNTSTDPVDVSVITNGGSVYLRGEYEDIYLEGKALPVSSSIYPNVHGTVSVADTDQPVALTLNFVGEDCGVTYLGDDDLTINDGVADVLGSPTVYAPNATVKMSGKYDEVTATVSENTLVLNNGFHANKLTVLKGNILVNGLDIAEFVDELNVSEDCVISYAEYHVTQSSNSKLMASSLANGKVILDEDIELTKGRQLGTLASGKELIDLNGHTWKCGDTRATESNTGSFFLRNAAKVTIMDSIGGGVFENNHGEYLIWANGENVEVNIMSGEFRGYTHTLYAHTGTINVYGGVFKLLDADTAERDSKGHLKFLLNCLDENYTSGVAHINVYGGKFYEFNPAETYGEPGGPVSYVASGYKVVESEEDGKAVFEVIPE